MISASITYDGGRFSYRYQSRGAECKLAARSDCPMREILQGRRGKLVKHAQLYPVGAGSKGSEPVGSIIYEIRMRRRIDAAVHSFMQRYPETAAIALTPVRPGIRTQEAVITILSASGLRLRHHGMVPAPYVHFDFFEFGEHETNAKEGPDVKFDQEFRFPIDSEGDFTEYLKQASLRFHVFDENEEDAAAFLGVPGGRGVGPGHGLTYRC